MQIGDVVLADKNVYEVTGIYLGGVGTTNLVGLKSVTERPGYAGNHKADVLSELTTLRAQLAVAQAANERDRSNVATGIVAIEKALRGHEWLRLGRGSYEWDDDKWRDEFGTAMDKVYAALDPLRKIASDLTNSPTTTEAVQAARRKYR